MDYDVLKRLRAEREARLLTLLNSVDEQGMTEEMRILRLWALHRIANRRAEEEAAAGLMARASRTFVQALLGQYERAYYDMLVSGKVLDAANDAALTDGENPFDISRESALEDLKRAHKAFLAARAEKDRLEALAERCGLNPVKSRRAATQRFEEEQSQSVRDEHKIIDLMVACGITDDGEQQMLLSQLMQGMDEPFERLFGGHTLAIDIYTRHAAMRGKRVCDLTFDDRMLAVAEAAEERMEQV